MPHNTPALRRAPRHVLPMAQAPSVRSARPRPPLPRQPPGRRAAQLWWLDPVWLVLAFAVPVYLSFLVFDYTRVVPNAYVPSGLYWWGLALLAALATGAAFGSRIDFASQPLAAVWVPPWVSGVLLGGVLMGYLVWFHPLALRPELVLDVIFGTRANVRDVVRTVPPWTTMTQLGCAYVVAYAVRRAYGRTAAWERLGLWAIVAAAAFRSVVWSERLALIEVLVCYGGATFAYHRIRGTTRWQLATIAPLAAPFVVYFVFTATEYFRSWDFYRNYYDSIWQFAYERLTAYYAVATNNGIGLLTESHRWPVFDGSYVFQWAYGRPDPDASNFLMTPTQYDYREFLYNYARPELNNPSGLFPIVYDIGYAGSALYFLLIGAVVGIAFRAFRETRFAGAVFYPVCLLFLLELLRFNYFAASRFIPVAMALVLIFVASHRRSLWPAPHYAGGVP